MADDRTPPPVPPAARQAAVDAWFATLQTGGSTADLIDAALAAAAPFTRQRPTTEDATEVNWTLINNLATKPHPLLNIQDDHRHECCPYDGEILQAARSVHHLLDMAGVSRGKADSVYSSDLDARTYLLLAEVLRLRERLQRISGWHARETGPGGMVGDFCTECGETWPCDTRRMADGTYVDSEEPNHAD